MEGRLNVFIYSIGFDQPQTERGDELAGLMVWCYFSIFLEFPVPGGGKD